MTVGGGHASGQLGWIHFGLGGAGDAQIWVTWPGGEVGPWVPVTANGYFTIDRGASQAIPWSMAGKVNPTTPPTRTARLADIDLIFRSRYSHEGSSQVASNTS